MYNIEPAVEKRRDRDVLALFDENADELKAVVCPVRR